MVTNINEGRRKPLLSLETTVPEPKIIEIDGEAYDMRAVASYTTRERKRLQSLLTAIVEYEAAEEETITVDDERNYKLALRQVIDISMPDLPDAVHAKLDYMHYGAIASEVIKLFRERNDESGDAVPSPRDEKIEPKRLRNLQKTLTSRTPWQRSSDSTEDAQAGG